MSDRVPTYVDIDRLCFELCICPDTAKQWIKDGRLPPPKPGRGKFLWKWREVEAAIDGITKSAAVSPDIGAEIENYARAATQGPHRR